MQVEGMRAQEARQVFAKNLRSLMAQRGISQIQLCERFGWTPSTVSDWCRGKKYPRVERLHQLAGFFGLPPSALTEPPRVGRPYEPARRIPILGRVSAGLPLFAQEQIEGYTYTDRQDGGEYFALRVQGDSMNALRINEGDVLVVRRQDIVENGEVAVVLVGEDEATVKRFYQSGEAVTLMPQSLNPAHQPQTYRLDQTPVRVLGKVVENKIQFE